MASEIIARKNAGVPVRILMDTEANVSTPRNITRLAEFEAAGIPMREKVSGGILHWKMMLFAGQGIVEFSGANYSSDAWTITGPEYTNYTDESIYFTSKASIVNSFKTKFDDIWTNTSDYSNYRNVIGPLTRTYGPAGPIDPDLNFVPSESHAVRAIAAYEQETRKIDVTMYRITDSRYADAMIAAKQRGISVRLITAPQQYRDPVRQFHSWNIDRMYMAGIDIRHSSHPGLNHQKSVLLHDRGTTIFGSSNWSSASSESQEEHNLFTTDAWVFGWFVDQFERKWNNLAKSPDVGTTTPLKPREETTAFVPLPPDQPTGASPNQETGVNPAGVTLYWNGGYWAHKYDVYLGTSAAAMTKVGDNVPRAISGHDYNSLALSPLVSGTTYYWRVVAKTMANMEAASPIWSFTTSGTAPAPPPPAPKLITLVRQPYLQQVTPTSAVVVWATREPGEGKLLVTGPTGSAVTVTAPWKLYAATATGMAADYYQFEAKVTGLTAGTTYTYDIIVADEDLNAVTDTFKTAPATSASSVTFVAFGDSGTGSTGQQQVASRLQQDNFDIALHGGDIAYENSSGTGPASHQTMHDWFFTPYSSWLRNKPVFPSMGNHDSRATNADGRPYLDLYVLPTQAATAQYPDHAERYYSFDYGPIHVIVLDTELAFQDPARRAVQMAWAEADLAATTKPWKVALYHRSIYSAGGENGSELPVREVFGPLFDKYGVHLALSAHEHDYERTKPLLAGAVNAAGTTYVVSGGGGGPLYPAGVAEWTAKSASVHHYVRGTATECTITLSAIGVDGVAFDTVELRRCSTPTEPPPTEPPPTPPPVGAPNAQLGEGDILLYAADATTLVGRWQKEADPTAAGGFKLRNPDAGGAKRTVALANPTDYFEMTFTAVPNVPYRFYMRGRADGDTYSNDSVFVQFVGANGYAIGSTEAAEYNLEDCSGCRVSGWGWQDNAWGVGVASTPITFTTPGPHKMRVQVREDGLSIDQILFSPTKFFSTWPGTLLNDTKIYPRSSSSTTPPPGNAAPTVALTAPASGSTFTAPATVSLTANAADSDGTVASVAFYAGATLIGTDTSAPFAATWSNVGAGSYSLTARATDNTGAVATSTAVSVTVQAAPAANVGPTVSLTAPAAGASFTAPATINLTANATDSDGTVASVAFYAGATLIGTDTSAPFATTWSNVAAGSYSLTARATDNTGAVTTSSAVTITVQAATPTPNGAPTVSLTAPAAGATFTAPATINLTANAADSDGTVASVAFYAGATLIGTDTSAPFAATWSNVAAGSYSLTARATDNTGAVTTSSAVTITVQAATPTPNGAPTVSLTAPTAGATFTAPATIDLTANAADSDGTVASVAFYSGATLIGTDTSAPFAATWSNVAAGSYSLTARATDNAGAVTTSSPVSVTVQPGAAPPAPAWTSQDIGAVGLAGTFAESNGVFTIEGAGADIWGTADAFRYSWKPLSGDADIVARVSSIEYVHAWVKAGVMIREQLTADSPQALMLVSPGKGLAFQRRITTAGLSTSTSAGSGTAPAWVKLERRANTITAYRSDDGVNWTLVGSDMFTMGANVYVGLAVSSHVTTSLATAVFDNVTIRPVGAGDPEPPPPANAAPTVTLASPVNGTTFVAPAATTLSASASDSDGIVARVDFYSGTTLIGSDTAAPFEASWSGVPAGTYTLTARATDDDGAITTSSPVTVTVQPQGAPPPPALSAPWTTQDIGAVGVAGSASDASGVFTVKGAGADIWGSSDAFRYVWQPVSGDVDVIARVSSVEYVHAWVKAGVMIREQLTADSAHALMLVSPGKGVAFQRRSVASRGSTSTAVAGTAPMWVKLERRGNAITAFRSTDGVTWTLVGSDTFTMGANVHVGLAVSSHVTGQLATALFDSVTVIKR